MPNHTSAIADVVHRHMEKPSTSWSIGSFGAIAEFHLESDEAVTRELSSSGGVILTERGGISIELMGECQPAPYEILRRGNHRWLHGVNLCLPENLAARTGRQGLTELGADQAALRPEDRNDILFDMGLGIAHVDVCIRTADKEFLAVLRSHLGDSILTGDNPVMAAIKSNSPHRVFQSNAGRVEVYQGIGSSTKGIPTPQGPHTHVLPRLLQHRRTHAANISVPAGHYPSLSMFPANPTSDELGNLRPFDAVDHREFQELIDVFADPDIVRLKERVIDAVREGEDPWIGSLDRQERIAIRVTLRQLYWTDGVSTSLSNWLGAFETTKQEGDETDPYGH
jgi:hypothetical protein